MSADADPQRVETWTVRIRFTWTGPVEALERLRDLGDLEPLDADEYVCTLPITGDTGPGSHEERSGRASWIANDVLVSVLTDVADVDEEGMARHFVHHSTELAPMAGEGPPSAPAQAYRPSRDGRGERG